jgi:hypothetical protein
MKHPNQKKEEIVVLPNGMSCYQKYEKEALEIYNNAYKNAFDGENYEFAGTIADISLMKYLDE